VLTHLPHITVPETMRRHELSRPANEWGTAPRCTVGDRVTTGAVQATRTWRERRPGQFNWDFSRSFLRHFYGASVASSQPHLWDNCLPAPACASRRWITAGKYPDMMPQAIKLTDAEGRSCIYVPITQNGKVVDSQGFVLDAEDDDEQ